MKKSPLCVEKKRMASVDNDNIIIIIYYLRDFMIHIFHEGEVFCCILM